jgi:hypothetical protein
MKHAKLIKSIYEFVKQATHRHRSNGGHKGNGYLDYAGGWGVDMWSRKRPQPGDIVDIQVVYRDGVADGFDEVITEVLSGPENPSGTRLERYFVAIASQANVNKLMAMMKDPATHWEYKR